MNILYVEDDPRDADLTRRKLRKAAPHFNLDLIGTQHEALVRLSGTDASRYDLVLTDMRLRDGDGLAILTHIRARALPLAVVLITGVGDEETAVAVLKAGANDYVVKRGDYLARLPLTLEGALRHYRAEAVRHARPLRVLYAEDNATDVDLLRRHLAIHAPHIHLDMVSTAADALQRLPVRGHVSDYDLLLLDYRLPGLNALEMLKELYQVRGLDMPVVLVTGRGDEDVALQALKLGAADYVPKNPGYLYQLPSVLENAFHRDKLAREQAALRESEARFRRLAENAQDIIYRYCLTPTPGFEYISPAVTTITGYTPEELYTDPALGFNRLHPDDRPLLEAAIRKDTPLEMPPTFRWIRKDGTMIWSESRHVPIYDEAGNLVAIEGIVRDITERKRAEEELQQSVEKLHEALEGTVHILVAAIEMRDPYTAGHQRRATQLACAIANEMDLPEEQIEGIRMAGLIHDLGKISIPAEVLSKPGQLSNIESDLIKAHPEVGHSILKAVEFPWPVAEIMLQHHERVDGSGYPQGLLAEEIVPEARILGVADVMEAMASHRPYRPAHGIDKALEEISQNRGILYDAEVVEICLKLFTEKGFMFE